MRWLLNRIALLVFTFLCFWAINTLCSIEITAYNCNSEQQRKVQSTHSDFIISLTDNCNALKYITTGFNFTTQFSKDNRTFDSSGYLKSYQFIFANKLQDYCRTIKNIVVLFSKSDIIFPFHYYW